MKQPDTLPTPCVDRVDTGLDQKNQPQHRVHIPRPRPRPKTLKERGLGGKKDRRQSSAASYGLKATTKNDQAFYEWPEALYELRSYLERWGVDVGALKSERQALWLVKKLGRQGKRMPNRLAPLFPALLKIQRTLCPVRVEPRKAPPSAKTIPGTFGAASPVRSISVPDYLAQKAAEQNGGVHG